MEVCLFQVRPSMLIVFMAIEDTIALVSVGTARLLSSGKALQRLSCKFF